MASAKMLIKQISLPPGLRQDEVELVHQAVENQESSRGAIRELLESRPDLVLVIGTRAADLEQVLVGKASGGRLLEEETIRAELRALRDSLREEGDGVAERLLIEQVALGWLALTTAQILREQRRAAGISLAAAQAWDRHASRVQGDFLRTVKTLAAVRRLRLPTLQVNVARQQVNVAG